MNEAREPGQQSPDDHDAGDPFPRAPDFGQHRAGNLQEAISEKEDARAEAEYLVRESELARHLQSREADVDAIEVGSYVEQEKEWKQTAGDLAMGAVGRRLEHCGHGRLKYTTSRVPAD